MISIQTKLRLAKKEKKKNFVPNTFPTWTKLEKSKKKNSQKTQKIKKHHFDIISIQTGLR